DAAGSVTLVGSDNAADTAITDSMPARLADGRVVFASNRDGGPSLWITTSSSTTAKRLFAMNDDDEARFDPAPCGTDRILFAVSRTLGAPPEGTPRDLRVAALDGSAERPLTRSPADDHAPCLLADQRTVIFVSDRGGAPRLHRLDLDAPDPETTVRAIETGAGATPAEAYSDAAPACLADGSILFARTVAGRPSQVMALAPGTTPPVLRQITEANVLPFGAGEPAPIGGGLFLLTAGPGKGPGGKPRYGVYRLSEGGFNLKRVTRDGAGYSDWARGLELLRSSGR
ncbi:MAG TPA: hypothetical protein VJV75_04730, partial [Candidatus Polarisedimenticolia bacterium]|nr:hypothetical protein [Candidatus Polarisedimenticolia bacterium]